MPDPDLASPRLVLRTASGPRYADPLHLGSGELPTIAFAMPKQKLAPLKLSELHELSNHVLYETQMPVKMLDRTVWILWTEPPESLSDWTRRPSRPK
jgi:hypothetical protein